jgi:hypothetical protein
MSERSTDDTLAMAHDAIYPVMLSHAWFRDLKIPRNQLGTQTGDAKAHWNEQRSEIHSSARTLGRIRELGGVVGVITNQAYVESGPKGSPLNDCNTSSKSFAQAYVYTVQKMAGKGGVGFGTDFNGFAGQPGPRFGKSACGASGPAVDKPTCDSPKSPPDGGSKQTNPVLYRGETTVDGVVLFRNRDGKRCFDFNYDGLAHYGLLPDLIADLQGIGTPPDVLYTVFNSAAAYIAMWERAVERAGKLRASMPISETH